MTEFGFIDRIKDLFATLPDNGFEGIGDDCAVLPVGGGESLVFTTDMLAEGVHFLRTATSARGLGRKSLAVNLSDVASMGARPIATLLSLSLPDDATGAWAEEFMQGYRELSQEFGVTLAGGDTTRSAAGITINVTAIGRAADTHIKRRSGARPGDVIFTAGALGASGAGLRDILAGRYLAAFRGRKTVMAVCYQLHAQRILALSYGVVPILRNQELHDKYHFLVDALEFLDQYRKLKGEDLLAIVGGSFGPDGGASYVEIANVDNIRRRNEEIVAAQKC